MRDEGKAVPFSSSSDVHRIQRGGAGQPSGEEVPVQRSLSVEKLYRRCTGHLHTGKLQEVIINVNFHSSKYLL